MYLSLVTFILVHERGTLMTQRLELYKCEICGNLVEILNASVGELVCCSQPMKVLIPHTTEDSSITGK